MKKTTGNDRQCKLMLKCTALFDTDCSAFVLLSVAFLDYSYCEELLKWAETEFEQI